MNLEYTGVRLLVNDYGRSFHFYRDVLDLPVYWGDEGTGYASFGTDRPLFAIFGRQAMAEAVGQGKMPPDAFHQDKATLNFAVPHVDEACRQLSDRGVAIVVGPADHPGWEIRTAHFRDPDGTLIEINEPLTLTAADSDQHSYTYRLLTPDRWEDFVSLFGERGACGGCWCMWWRLPRRQFEAQKGDGNREAMRGLVADGVVPGLLAYHEDEAVGWCSVGPRGDFPALARSRILKPVDDLSVWSVVCFFVAKSHRGRGLTTRLLLAAAGYARESGARILEGYPVEPRKSPSPAPFLYTGIASAFLRAGFSEVARRSETRPIMRLALEEPSA